ncbi:hypothetical protein CR513_49311, partial [Mucuna pruriens]
MPLLDKWSNQSGEQDVVTFDRFAYNKIVNKTTSCIPFELAYGFNPLSRLDLVPLSVLSKANPEGLSKA